MQFGGGANAREARGAGQQGCHRERTPSPPPPSGPRPILEPKPRTSRADSSHGQRSQALYMQDNAYLRASGVDTRPQSLSLAATLAEAARRHQKLLDSQLLSEHRPWSSLFPSRR
ncbi:hypothetical protein CC78DRAFT_580806 [Lojkania enalia]|uniref:Uncharacterized protein n=1 Tax=Lojkania enalia TaxID=147567 RepID=A0A9P4KAG2_9PLEO|nr:hypothetical protein CC78DRAFT_580806 [Didymosphaeria enalia]